MGFLILPLLFLSIVNVANAQITTSTTSANATAEARAKLRQQAKIIMQPQGKATPSGIGTNIRSIVQAKRVEFKANLEKIKDVRKKALVEKIDTKISEINDRLTKRFLATLVSIQGFLDKIKQSTTDASTLASIAAAQSAVDTARSAVEIQAAKTYTMEITDDTTLRANAGATVSQFRKDMTTTYQLVLGAKQAVQNLNTQRRLIRNDATHSANL